MEEAHFLRRKATAGRLDAHPTDNAIIVNYEVAAEILSDSGIPVGIADAKRCQKIIRVRSLSEDTDIEAFAENILSQCKLISPTRFPELCQLLAFLVSRSQSKEFKMLVAEKAKEQQRQKSLLDHTEKTEEARLTEIDTYIEYLYDDVRQRVRGTALILQIAQKPANLEDLAFNETVMGALARVLRDDGQKSMELSTNIIHIFFILSSFTSFHDVLKNHKIGVLCLKTMEHEIKRYNSWQVSLKKKMQALKSKKSEEATLLLERYNDQCFRQESLLYVAVHLLLNLAEDTRVQIKMKNRSIVQHLMSLLDRDNVEFLVLVVNFLKKLSIFAENKDEMRNADIVNKLVRLMHSPHELLVHVTLGLLLNLSFDTELRVRIVELGLLPRIAAIGSDVDAPMRFVLGILYHMSMDEGTRPQFATVDAVWDMVNEILVPKQDEHASLEVLALFINLATDSACAACLCHDDGLDRLVARALDTGDPLIMKLVRNISRHDVTVKELFLKHIDALAAALLTDIDDDMLVEILGVFGNLIIPDLDYQQLLEEYSLLDFINEKLLPSAADDDIVLQLLILVGTCLADPECANMIARSGVVENLMDLLEARQEDSEIVVQIVYVFYKLLYYPGTRTILMSHSKAIEYMIDLMNDQNHAIKSMCESALDIVVDANEDWAKQIRLRKFEFHNATWIETMQQDSPMLRGDGDVHDDSEHMYYGDQYTDGVDDDDGILVMPGDSDSRFHHFGGDDDMPRTHHERYDRYHEQYDDVATPGYTHAGYGGVARDGRGGGFDDGGDDLDIDATEYAQHHGHVMGHEAYDQC